MFRILSILLIVGSIMLTSTITGLANMGKQTQSDLYYQVIYNDIVERSPMGPEWSAWMAETIVYYSKQYKLDPLLVTALFHQESGFNMGARSRTGAVGIAQLQPETAAGLGFDAIDPAQNIEGGIKYLGAQLARFSQSGEWAPTYAIAAYNAGPGAVTKYQGVPPYPETQNHVNRVAEIYKELQKAMGY